MPCAAPHSLLQAYDSYLQALVYDPANKVASQRSGELKLKLGEQGLVRTGHGRVQAGRLPTMRHSLRCCPSRAQGCVRTAVMQALPSVERNACVLRLPCCAPPVSVFRDEQHALPRADRMALKP